MDKQCAKRPCIILLKILTLAAVATLLTFDCIAISNYDIASAWIDYWNSPNIKCIDACGNNYVQYNSQCCLWWDIKGSCLTLKFCIQNKISLLENQQINAIPQIWAFSFSTLIALVCYCIVRKCAKKLQQRTTDLTQDPLLESMSGSINRSEQDNKYQKTIEDYYKSFAYQDDQSTCCICLEEFSNEKAILLKCGHIFHSKCIRDWAKKQENCPICRSKQ